MIYEKKDWPPGAEWCREIPFLASQWGEPDEDGVRRLRINMTEHNIQIAPDRMMPFFRVLGRCRTGELTKTWGSVGTTACGNPENKMITLKCADAYEGVLIVWGN